MEYLIWLAAILIGVVVGFLFGKMEMSHNRPSVKTSDFVAILSDWQTVGADMQNSITHTTDTYDFLEALKARDIKLSIADTDNNFWEYRK